MRTRIDIDKEINLSQLCTELDAANPPGLKSIWDGNHGSVEVLRGGITKARLQAAVDSHVPQPEPEPEEEEPVDHRQEFADARTTAEKVTVLAQAMGLVD